MALTSDRFPLARVSEYEPFPIDRGVWPATLPPIGQVLEKGLDLGAATVLVGENGSGKSTLVEAISIAYGMSPHGGSRGSHYETRSTESLLWQHLQLDRNFGTSRGGFFLRAETMHGFFTYLEDNPGQRGGEPEPRFHELSHGESFLELILDRFRMRGLYILDEPESALSFSGCLSLLAVLGDLLKTGESQVILSTHSPLLASLPGAQIYEVGDWGLRQSEWDELSLVQNWKSFMDAPQRFLKYL
jgi:predicted ATPase